MTNRIKIRGEFFEALSSQRHECFLIHENDEITIETREGIIVRDLRIDSVQGADNVYFVCGRYFKSDQPLPREFFGKFQNKTQKIISWLEEFSPDKAVILSLILLGFVLFYRVVLSSTGETIALIFPDHWEREIGEHSYRGLRRIALSESALTARRQDHLRERAKEMAERAELARRPQILFHDTDLLGAECLRFSRWANRHNGRLGRAFGRG
uniref:Uncharacterized protein n=1 Tax=Candidatus Kentrum sp. LPFa TaxID=2126335 RepID=A0A450XWL0_9GAMM|nr:MAG: hypothetical protein BECKLPF1236A_GA0070988_102193 [Candidatus Kentron sp. LPFa]VFK33662.1 MAG: hypothetical protein BECKLPF1236C_GA0070990_102183 [Candidatus Kentron sp. LPFa]